MIIEDNIKLNYESIYEINIPTHINMFDGTGSIRISASLSYNHIPILSDHLNYNPIHIAYRLLSCSEQELKQVTDQIKTLEVKLRNLSEGSEEYDRVLAQKEVFDKQKEQYVIKIGGKGWSHDNFYWNQYGNNQSLGNNTTIKKATLRNKLNQRLFIEIRCNIKTTDPDTNIFREMKDFMLDTEGKVVDSVDDINRYFDQKFGLCITIEDIS